MVPAATSVAVVTVGTGTEAEIGGGCPIGGVVTGLIAGEGVVGDLVLLEAGCLEFLTEQGCHLEAGVVVARGEFAFCDAFVQWGAVLDAEVVGGDVLGTELQDFVDAVFPGREGLGGETVHQVEAEVVDAGVAEEVDGLTDVGGVVATVEEAELAIDEGLDAEGEAGDEDPL